MFSSLTTSSHTNSSTEQLLQCTGMVLYGQRFLSSFSHPCSRNSFMYWTLFRASETRILWLCVSAGTTELRQSCLSHWGARPCSLPKMLALSPGTPSSSRPCPNTTSQKPRTFPSWADELVKPNWVLRRWEKLQWKPGHPTPNLSVLFCWKGHNIPKRKAIKSYCTRQRIVYFPPPVLRRKCNIYQGSNDKLEKFHSGP